MLRFSAACSSVTLLALALAGCGGGGGAHSAIVPPTGGGQSATSPPAKTGVTFTIVVPKESGSTLTHRPAYVSPATQSMTLDVTGTSGTANPTGFPMTVGLTTASSDCTSSLAGTTCTVPLVLSPGKYAAAVSTFDGANGAGNELSTNQDVAFTVTADTNNVVPMTLSGIPTQIDPTYLGSGKFMVVALDADNNYIVGAGAPTFTVAKSGGSSVVTITQPTTSAPNAFSIAETSTTGSETLTITAGYPSGETSGCTQTGAVCTSSFTASSNQYLFALNYYASDVLGFSLPFTSSSQTPAFTFGDYEPYANGIALDSNGNLFFSGPYYYSEPVYEVAAGYTGAPTALFTGYVYGLAFDSNNDLFVSNPEEDEVAEYAAPYTGTAIKTFSIDDSESMALDSSNDLFVGNDGYSYVTEYPYASGSYGSAVEITTGSEPAQLWFDASGDLWVASYSGGEIQEFKPPFSSSSLPALTITGYTPADYCPGAFDSSGDLFVASYATSGEIYEYKASTISANQGGTISSADVTFSAGEYPCVAGLDGAGNLYVTTSDGFGNTDGAIGEFSPPFSNSSTPVYTVTSGIDETYGNNVITKLGQLTVTL